MLPNEGGKDGEWLETMSHEETAETVVLFCQEKRMEVVMGGVVEKVSVSKYLKNCHVKEE